MTDVRTRNREPQNTARWIGASVTRLEDNRLLRGLGRFVDDIDPPEALVMALGRSPYAHARIVNIRWEHVLELDGVHQVLIGDEVARRTDSLGVLRPLPDVPVLPFLALATGRVLFEGHPVISVVATSRAVAEDAIAAIDVEYEPLDHVVDTEAAVAKGAPVIWDELESNLVVSNIRDHGQVESAFAQAAITVKDRFIVSRVTGLPMEGRAILAHYVDGLGTLDILASTQVPHMYRLQLAQALRFPESSIRVVAHDIGGGFGLKLGIYPEDVLACLHSIDLGRPVKWIEDRFEHFRATTHARESIHYAQLAIDQEQRISAIKDRYYVDMGAYNSPFGPPMLSSLMLPGPYRIESSWTERNVVATNKTPVGAFRGYGQPESCFVREVLVDRAARTLRHDPVDFRMRNLLSPEEFPWDSPTGAVYDSGDYQATLQLVVDKVRYQEIKTNAESADSRYKTGVGVACFVEMTGYPGSKFLGKHKAVYGAHESVTIRANRSGGFDLYTGVSSFGQGTETTFAQVCASVLGVDPHDIVVHAGDTKGTPYNVGGFASRTTIAGTGAILAAANEVRAKALRIGAYHLGVDGTELDIVDGVISAGPLQEITMAEVASEAISGHRLPVAESPGLEATAYFDPPASAFGYGAAAAVVEVDAATGAFEVNRFVMVHDGGTLINPMLVDGQLQGGLAQGFGAALTEQLVYDPDSGQLLNGTMIDYLVPTAADLPNFELDHLAVPSPVTPLGVRGVGEAGTIPPAAAIANAICDALAPTRIEIRTLPITSETVWRAMREANEKPPWKEISS